MRAAHSDDNLNKGTSIMTNTLPTILASELDGIRGGLFGLLGGIADADTRQLNAQAARHWNRVARRPGATDGEKAMAKYKNQFVPWYLRF